MGKVINYLTNETSAFQEYNEAYDSAHRPFGGMVAKVMQSKRITIVSMVDDLHVAFPEYVEASLRNNISQIRVGWYPAKWGKGRGARGRQLRFVAAVIRYLGIKDSNPKVRQMKKFYPGLLEQALQMTECVESPIQDGRKPVQISRQTSLEKLLAQLKEEDRNIVAGMCYKIIQGYK